METDRQCTGEPGVPVVWIVWIARTVKEIRREAGRREVMEYEDWYASKSMRYLTEASIRKQNF